MIAFSVAGIPAPQGSKRHVGNGIMVEMSKELKPWRLAVQCAAHDAMQSSGMRFPLSGPLHLKIVFMFKRPKGHYGTGKNGGRLKPSVPFFYAKTPDIDKLVRSTSDALTISGLWIDDGQVAELSVIKLYSDAGKSGAFITVATMDEQTQ